MNQLEKSLKTKKLRLTNARKVIFDLLAKSEKPLSPKSILDRIHQSKTIKADQASVYRNLMLFTEIGLVHRLDSGRYTMCKYNEHDCSGHRHIIINCSVCGAIQELNHHQKDVELLTDKLTQLIDNYTDFTDITLSGKCNDCAKN